MNDWHTLNLGDGIMAAMPSAEIEERFQLSAPLLPEMAVFVRSESEGRLHCEVIAYFSPAAAALAKAFEAQPCPKPARAGLSLLAGAEQAWSLLFGEDTSSAG